MGTPVAVHAPVTWEEGGDTGGARAVGVAVKEGEVGGHKVRALLHPDRQLGGEVRLPGRDDRQQVVPGVGESEYYSFRLVQVFGGNLHTYFLESLNF